MAWDRNRPVAYRRIIKEWLIYAAAIVAVFVLFFSDRVDSGTFVGIALSGPIYVAFVAITTKFGYQRQRLIRAPRSKRPTATSTATSTRRTKPTPTSRTGARKKKR